jgi:hypothetical protein
MWCRIDTDVPGANLAVLGISEDGVGRVTLHAEPEQRGGTEEWFWWRFRIHADGPGTIRLHLRGRRCLAGSGPVLRGPDGAWRRVAATGVDTVELTISDAGVWDAALAHPYQLADWQAWSAGRSGHPMLAPGTLAVTRNGRDVPLLRVGTGNRLRVTISARHHACECMANWVLEGLLDAWLDHSGCDRLRREVELLAIPFVDLDGVEDGDQGKARAPHDHNGDYEALIYPETRAISTLLPSWGSGRWRMALDLHCPWVGGPGHEHIYLVNCPDPARAARQLAFAGLIEGLDDSGLGYQASGTLAWGTDWNRAPPERRRSFSRWAGSQPGMLIAAGMEIPYALARGTEVTPEKCRAFGRVLALAIAAWHSNGAAESDPPSRPAS